jgi:hypothetical protein
MQMYSTATDEAGTEDHIVMTTPRDGDKPDTPDDAIGNAREGR